MALAVTAGGWSRVERLSITRSGGLRGGQNVFGSRRCRCRCGSDQAIGRWCPCFARKRLGGRKVSKLPTCNGQHRPRSGRFDGCRRCA